MASGSRPVGNEPMTPQEAAVIAEFLGDAEMNEWERRGDLPHVVAPSLAWLREASESAGIGEAWNP